MTIRCAVLGSPIQHSLSPTLHQLGYKILGVPGEYSRFEVTAAELGDFLLAHPPREWNGFSLTMPLKEVAVNFAKSKSADVRASGVLNTLVAVEGGWSGFNTDVIAIRSLLQSKEFNSVAILGAGGTARAALAAIAERDCNVQLLRRSPLRDNDLRALRNNLQFADWNKLSSSLAVDLLINTVPASALVDMDLSGSGPRIVLDAIYSPWPPPLALWKSVGTYISGKDLLVEQGIEQIRLFTGANFENSLLRGELRKALQ